MGASVLFSLYFFVFLSFFIMSIYMSYNQRKTIPFPVELVTLTAVADPL